MDSDSKYNDLVSQIAQELAEESGLSCVQIDKSESFLYVGTFEHRFCESKEERYQTQVVIATDQGIDHTCKDFKARSLGVLKKWKEVLDEARCRKYKPLEHFLLSCSANIIYMSHGEIEKIIKHPLPSASYESTTWWENHRYYIQANAWLNAGYQVDQVKLQEQIVVFVANPLVSGT